MLLCIETNELKDIGLSEPHEEETLKLLIRVS